MAVVRRSSARCIGCCGALGFEVMWSTGRPVVICSQRLGLRGIRYTLLFVIDMHVYIDL